MDFVKFYIKGGAFLFFLLTFSFIGCIQDKEIKPLGQAAITLKTADGGTISNPNADDYNPQALVLPDGKIGLFFGSNRDGSHKIYFTTSTTAYDPNGKDLVFNNPLAVTVSGNPAVTSTSRIPFVAVSDTQAPKALFAYTDTNALDTIYTCEVTDFANATGNCNQSPDKGLIMGKWNGGYFSTDPGTTRVLLLVYKNNQLYLLEPNGASELMSPEPTVSDKTWLSILPNGIHPYGSAFITSWDDDFFGGFLMGFENGLLIGGAEGLNEPLAEQGLGITYHSNLEGNQFFFSAGNSYSGNQDLYVVTSHQSIDLWQQVYEFAPPGSLAGPPPDGFGAFFPDAIPGLVAWYDASSLSGTSISSWPDLSPTGLNLSGSGALLTNDYLANAAINIDGLAQNFYNMSTSISVGEAIIIAKATTNSIASKTLIEGTDIASAAAPLVSFGTTANQLVQTSATVMGAATNTVMPTNIYQVIQTSFATAQNLTSLYVGSSSTGTSYFPGNILEVILYDHALTQNDNYMLWSYLKDRYKMVQFLPLKAYMPSSNDAGQSWATTDDLWLRADAGISGTQWTEIATNTTPDILTLNGSPTVSKVINGQEAVQFVQSSLQYADNTGFTWPNSTYPNSQIVTIVYQMDESPGTERVLISSVSGTSGFEVRINTSGTLDIYTGITLALNNVGPIHAINEPHILRLELANNYIGVYVDGNLVAEKNTGITYTNGTGLSLAGSGATGNFTGSIAEVTVHGSNVPFLTNTDRDQIDCYLSVRYTIPLTKPCPF